MFMPACKSIQVPPRLSSRRLLQTHLAAALLAAGGVACGAVASSSAGARQSAPPARASCPASYADQWPEVALDRRASARRG